MAHIAPKTFTKDDLKYIGRLRLEIWLFIGGFLFLWTLCMLLLYRHNRILRKKRRTGDKRIKLDEEEGDAQYVVSIFTGIKYKEPPTGIVKLHIIGSRYPGRFHSLVNPDPDATPVFRPLAREKFLVTEDVRLGRIIAIVLQTESPDQLSTWYCQTIIVREVRSKEAWLFRVNQNIDFPPVTIMTTTEEDLTSFSNSFHRRIRREVRQGQYIYFGFWFRTTHSVYRVTQRIVTSVVCHFFLLSFCLVFLGLVFSPAHHTISDGRLGIDYNIPEGKERAYWVYHALTIGSMASFLSSLVGYIMVSLFRQRLKYETQLEEMDYVIGTALHEHNEKKQKQAEFERIHRKARKLSKKKSKTTITETIEPAKTFPGIVVAKTRAQRALSKAKPLHPTERTALIDSTGEIAKVESGPPAEGEPETKSMFDSISAKLKSIRAYMFPKSEGPATVPPEGAATESTNNESTPGPAAHLPKETSISKNKRMKYNVADALVRKFRPFPPRNSEKEHSKSKQNIVGLTNAAQTPSKLEQGERKLSGHTVAVKVPEGSKSSLSINILRSVDQKDLRDQVGEKYHKMTKQPEPSAASTGIHTPIVYFADSDETAEFPHAHETQPLLGNTPLEKRAFMRQLFYADPTDTGSMASTKTRYLTPKLMEEAQRLKMLDVDGKSTWFGTPVPPERKLYRPISAWIFVFILVGLSFAGIVVTVKMGELQLHGDHEFFFLVLCATIIIALLFGTFIIETLKICLIAMVCALLDKGMYKKMINQDRTVQRNSGEF